MVHEGGGGGGGGDTHPELNLLGGGRCGWMSAALCPVGRRLRCLAALSHQRQLSYRSADLVAGGGPCLSWRMCSGRLHPCSHSPPGCHAKGQPNEAGAGSAALLLTAPLQQARCAAYGRRRNAVHVREVASGSCHIPKQPVTMVPAAAARRAAARAGCMAASSAPWRIHEIFIFTR